MAPRRPRRTACHRSSAAVQGTWARHACPLRPRGGLQVVQLHLLVALRPRHAAHNVDQPGPKPKRGTTVAPPTKGSPAVRIMSFASRASADHASTVSRRNPSAIAAKLRAQHRKQLGLGRAPDSTTATHWKTASSLLTTSRSSCTSVSTSAPVACSAGSSSAASPPTAAFSSAGRAGVGEPLHVERVGRRAAHRSHRARRPRSSTTSRADAQHLGQLALVDLALALVDEGQQQLERLGADALERVGGVRRVAHARLEQVEEVPSSGLGHPGP